MELKPCNKCIYYDQCVKVDDDKYPELPMKVEQRIYDLFIYGHDCFIEQRELW